jgi:propionyl-CoA carboxylase alpha chain
MNTRLQVSTVTYANLNHLEVEHPVTEYITGLDLVEMMIKVAAGERILLQQKDVPLKGWAMESRVYAEDPFRNFLPSIGILDKYREPKVEGGEVRVDSGIREGDEVSIFWDPLICKLVTYGQNRKEAIDTMGKALDSFVIRGVNHNISFLRACMDNAKYMR